MICENCGAEYDEHLLLCPYCGTENDRAAQLEHQKELHDLNEKTEKLRQAPESVARKGSQIVTKMAVAAVIGVLVVASVIWVVTRIQAGNALGQQEKQLAQLEEYYEAGDYEQMEQYLDSLEYGYSSTFAKYRNAVDWNQLMEYQLDMMENDAEYAKQGGIVGVSELEFGMNWTFETLYDIAEQAKRQYPHGEQAVGEEVTKQLTEALKEHYQLTDEEIATGISMQGDQNLEESAYESMAEDALERMEEQK